MTLVLGSWGAAAFFAVALVLVAQGLLCILLSQGLRPLVFVGLFIGVVGGSLLIVLCQGIT